MSLLNKNDPKHANRPRVPKALQLKKQQSSMIKSPGLAEKQEAISVRVSTMAKPSPRDSPRRGAARGPHVSPPRFPKTPGQRMMNAPPSLNMQKQQASAYQLSITEQASTETSYSLTQQAPMMKSERAHQTMLARHTVMMNHKITPGGRPGSLNKYPIRDTQKIKPQAE